jgi:hypothetical protein
VFENPMNDLTGEKLGWDLDWFVREGQIAVNCASAMLRYLFDEGGKPKPFVGPGVLEAASDPADQLAGLLLDMPVGLAELAEELRATLGRLPPPLE